MTTSPHLILVHDTKGRPSAAEFEVIIEEIKSLAEQNSEPRIFTPHLWLKVERDVPRQIAGLALVGVDRVLRIELPDLFNVATIPDLIVAHYQETNGHTPFFGKITGYYFHYLEGKCLVYSIEGEALHAVNEMPRHYGKLATISFNNTKQL